MRKRVGVIVGSTVVSKQVYDLIAQSSESENYEITTLVVNGSDRYSGNILSKIRQYIARRGLSKFLSNGLFKLLCTFEALVVSRNRTYRDYFSRYDLSKLNLEIVYVAPMVSKSGLVFRYSNDDLEAIKSRNLNLLVRGDVGILKGDILDICPNGVISFHHADNNVNRGGPPGFWEVYLQQPRTGFIVQRLRDELDGGDVLYKGFVPTKWMYMLNLVRLHEISTPFFHLVLEDITSNSPTLSVKEKTPYCHPLYTIPTPAQQLLYVFKTAGELVKKLWRKFIGRGYRWGVAYQFSESWSDVALWRSKKIPNPRGRFLADPFLIKKNGKHYCFVEDYDYKTSQGCISVYEVTESNSREVGVALSEDFHLSYPYLFEFDGGLYMCPETSQARDIRIYKCTDFPLQWELHEVLMSELSAADTNIFTKGGKWWLISNISTSHVGDHESELHAFYGDSPITKDWTPHPKNPVIFDPLRARNGGLICENGEIFRAYQRQGFNIYGEALGVSKLSTLTVEDYEEEQLFELEANFFKGAKGIHSYNYRDGLVVFDYVEVSKISGGV